jgi:hypothetical protein
MKGITNEVEESKHNKYCLSMCIQEHFESGQEYYSHHNRCFEKEVNQLIEDLRLLRYFGQDFANYPATPRSVPHVDRHG